MFKVKNKWLLASISVFLVSGCDLLPENNENNINPTSVTAVVSTFAADYSSGAVSVITGDSNRIALNELLPTHSDISVDAYGNNFYLIERYTGTNIAKFDINDISAPAWQYSTQDAPNDTVSSNPQKIVFVSDTKAYVLRYGKNTVWVVNPSATTEADFKTGEIDLGAYADNDGLAEISLGVVANGKLFVAMQRLESYAPVNTAYVAVIDTLTDTEIDAGISGDAFMGIPLTIKNPTNNMQYVAADNSIYVQGIGAYSGADFSGGVEKINLATYATTVVIDDGVATGHPDERVSGMAIVSPTLGYYISYKGWGNTALYRFNPSTGSENITSIAALATGDQSDIKVDATGNVWVSDVADTTVYVIDPQTDTLIDSVATVLKPKYISFIYQ